jgi:hypothetical protein
VEDEGEFLQFVDEHALLPAAEGGQFGRLSGYVGHREESSSLANGRIVLAVSHFRLYISLPNSRKTLSFNRPSSLPYAFFHYQKKAQTSNAYYLFIQTQFLFVTLMIVLQ